MREPPDDHYQADATKHPALILADQPAARGQDVGTSLLRMVEQEGARRGCKSGFLFTITDQAPGFNERNGWMEFGCIACDPPGTARIFTTKTLNEQPPS